MRELILPTPSETRMFGIGKGSGKHFANILTAKGIANLVKKKNK